MPVKDDVKLGKGTKIWHPDLVNLYGCEIGENCNIGAFVEIGKGVRVGNNVSIGAHCFIPEGVTIGDNCFIGPRVTFCNDIYPPSYGDHWAPITVMAGASIGASCTIVPGVIIGERVMVGAGSVVTKSIYATNTLHYGHPSKHKGTNPLKINFASGSTARDAGPPYEMVELKKEGGPVGAPPFNIVAEGEWASMATASPVPPPPFAFGENGVIKNEG